MSERKRPIFGIISLALMLGLFIGGAILAIYLPPPPPAGGDESLAVALGAAANVIATVVVMLAISVSSLILAGVSFLRRERRGPAAVGLCLALSSLIVLVMTITKL